MLWKCEVTKLLHDSKKFHTWHLIPHSLVLFQWDARSDDLAESQMRNDNAGCEN